EAKAEDIAFLMLRTFPKVLDNKQFAGLSGRIVELHKLSRIKRLRLIFNSFKQKIEPSAKRGVGRFESVLEAVDLGGAVHDDARRLLFEMSEIRHIIVHRNGVVDHKFVNSCRSFGLKEGDRIGVTLPLIEAYAHCLKWYIFDIDRRFRVFLNEHIPKEL